MSLDLNYITTGEGRHLIFQHGLGANLHQAQRLMADIDGWQTTSMDCRGHGNSYLFPGYIPSFENYTNDVLQLMDHLNIEKAVFGGISMGSGISLRMAIHHPDRVEGLILVRPAWLDQLNPENLLILLDIVKYLDQPGGQQAFEASPAFQAINRPLPKAGQSVLGQFSRPQPGVTGSILTHLVNDAPFESLEDLGSVNHPTLLIANEDDPLHPYDMAEVIASRLTNCKLEKVISRYVDDEAHRNQVRTHTSDFLNQFI